MRKPLGSLLVDAGLITTSDLESALEEHRKSDVRVGRVLVSRGLVSEARLTQVLSYQLGLPWVALGSLEIGKELLALVPRDIVVGHRLIPVHVRTRRRGERTLYVATDDPTNEAGLQACADHVEHAVRPMVAAPADVSRVLEQYYGVAATMAPPPSVEVTEEEWDFDLELIEEPRGALQAHVTQHPPAGSAPPAEPSVGPQSLSGHAELWVMGAQPEQIASFRQSVAPQDLRVVVAGLRDLEKLSERKPLALLVMEEVYAFDRASFNRVALRAGVPLLVWSDELDVDFLAPVLQTAKRR
jgi:hypothetical protein